MLSSQLLLCHQATTQLGVDCLHSTGLSSKAIGNWLILTRIFKNSAAVRRNCSSGTVGSANRSLVSASMTSPELDDTLSQLRSFVPELTKNQHKGQSGETHLSIFSVLDAHGLCAELNAVDDQVGLVFSGDAGSTRGLRTSHQSLH